MQARQFVLIIDLDNAEVAEEGIEEALRRYLRGVADRCARGSYDAGPVMDGNGNVIGKYRTDDSEDDHRWRVHSGPGTRCEVKGTG